MLELIVLAATSTAIGVIKPILPDVREFIRGTIHMMESLLPFSAFGLVLPQVKVLINCMKYTRRAKETYKTLSEIIDTGKYSQHSESILVSLLDTFIYDLEIYVEGHSAGQPAHRLESETKRVSDSAAATMHALACELFPQWKDKFDSAVPFQISAEREDS